MNHYIQKGMNQYAPMPGVNKLRKAIAKKIEKSYSLSIDPDEEICVVAGATQGIHTILDAFVHPGDEVIIIEPAYDSYLPGILVNKGVPVPYRVTAPDFRVDWIELEKLISNQTQMIIVNNPHNPTGKIFSSQDLEELTRISVEHDLLVLSDEVYEHMVFDGRKHVSALEYPELYKRCLTTFSFGKTFHFTGWKCGYVIAPPELLREFKKIHQFTVFTVHTPTQYAIAEFLGDSAHYDNLPDFFQKKRDTLEKVLIGTGFKPIQAEGTYFQLYDYSELSNQNDRRFCNDLVKENGVALIPLSPFYSDPPNDTVVRFCFAKTEETLLAAGGALKEG
jgi:methionine aminotransferase